MSLISLTFQFQPPQIYPFRAQNFISLSISSQNPRHVKKTQILASTYDSARSISSNIEGSSPSVIKDVKKQFDMVEHHEEQPLPLSDRWHEIHGSCDWDGLLDPMDPLLRKELIRYGEMSQACYDAFDYDPYSKYSGSSKYLRSNFFQSLKMEKLGYDVTRFLYATSLVDLPKFFLKGVYPDKDQWSESANWIGYVAVSNDETKKRLGRRDITIAWRGTVTRLEWLNNLKNYLGSATSDMIPAPDPNIKVESGFISLYTSKNESCRYCKYSARQQVVSEVKRLMEKYPDEELSITFTGHSLGSSLAILSAYDVAETGVNIQKNGETAPVSVFSFAGPRVGNVRFKVRLERLGVKVLRVINVHDIVPTAPGIFINEKVPEMVMNFVRHLPWSYTHAGVELALDHKNSTFLKQDEYSYNHAHDLEVYLHLLDGYHGKGHKFELATGRDIALVNKYSDFLKDRYRIPPKWKQIENKGMVCTEDGHWVQPERQIFEGYPRDMDIHLKELGI